jgi:nucleoid-associated protein YgaU
MTANARGLRTGLRRRQQSELRESRDRPKLIATLLFGGIFLLTGGGALIAVHPAADAAKDSNPTVANPNSAAATPAATAMATAMATATVAGNVDQLGDNRDASAVSNRNSNAVPEWQPFSAHEVLPFDFSRATKTSSSAVPSMLLNNKPAITYIVKSGDTLSGIATWFKLRGYDQLYAANKSTIGANPNLIRPGERITISGDEVKLQHSSAISSAGAHG